VHCRWPHPSPVDPRARFPGCCAPSPMWSGRSSNRFRGVVSPTWWAQPSFGGFWGFLLPLVLFCCQYEWLEFVSLQVEGREENVTRYAVLSWGFCIFHSSYGFPYLQCCERCVVFCCCRFLD
jgi:hypothetical protein